jgi:hypothetical protein
MMGTLLRRLSALIALLTLVAAALAAAALGADAHTGTIEDVSLSSSSGFVHNEASFKDVGAGSSHIAVWIEVYEGPHGPIKTTLGRKSATSACQTGRTCFTSLRTAVQAVQNECYVGRASTRSDGSTSEQRSPESGRLCP